MAKNKTKIDLINEFCSNENCHDYGKRDAGNIVKFGHDRIGKQQFKCKTCGGVFVETKNTIFYNRKLSEDRIILNNEPTRTAEAKERPGKTVSMTTNILPAISFVVTPGTLDFGRLISGKTGDAQTLTLSNTGGFNITITADVTDTAGNLFVDGLLLDSAAWSAYGISIAAAGSDTADAVLDVPDDYAGVGEKEGILVFWAQNARNSPFFFCLEGYIYDKTSLNNPDAPRAQPAGTGGLEP